VNETPLSDDEFKKLHHTLRQLALAAYPNSERKGCPGMEVLRDIASTSWPANHPGYEHVKHCSPCLREMFDLQEEIFVAKTRRRHRKYWIAVAAILVITAGVWLATLRLASRRSNPSATTNNIASIEHQRRIADLFDEPDALRSAEPQKPLKTIHLPSAPARAKGDSSTFFAARCVSNRHLSRSQRELNLGQSRRSRRGGGTASDRYGDARLVRPEQGIVLAFNQK
jgi:hypothetical protein